MAVLRNKAVLKVTNEGYDHGKSKFVSVWPNIKAPPHVNVNDPFSFVFLYFFYVHTCRLVCSSFIKH